MRQYCAAVCSSVYYITEITQLDQTDKSNAQIAVLLAHDAASLGKWES